MDYCAKIAKELVEWKRIMRVFCGMLVLLFVVGTANEFPVLDLKEADMVKETFSGTETTMPLDKDMDVKIMPDIVLEKIAGPEISNENPGTGAINWSIANLTIGDAVISDNGNKELTENFDAMVHISESYPAIDNQMIEDSFADQTVPDTTTDYIIIEQPSDNLINPPDEVVTIVPDIPAEEIVPETEDDMEKLPDSDNSQVMCVQGFLVDDTGMIYGFVPEELELDSGYLALPSEGCTGILRGAFQGIGTEITDIHIPNNITYIEEGAFADIPELYAIWTEEGNPNYTDVDGVLFDSSMTSILAFPTGWTRVYDVPEYVTRFADSSFVNTRLEKLQMKKCGLIEVGNAVFGEENGNGIVISAPLDYLEEYHAIFAGYQVIIN